MAKKKNTPAKSPGASAGGAAKGPMDVGLLEQIVKLMSANDLNTVDLRDGAKRVILRRGPVVGPTMQYAAAPMMSAQAAPSAPAAPSSAPAAKPAATDDDAGLV